MNRRLCTIPVHVLLLAGMIPLASGVEAAKPEESVPTLGKETASGNVVAQAAAKSSEVTFLGVEATCAIPLEEEKSALPSGVGLRVNYLVPGSPAAAHLRMGDVLLRMDDQLLCNPSQLRTLVHMKKNGDAVKFSFLREGTPREATFALKSILVPRELRPLTKDFSSDVRIILNGEEVSLRDLFDDQWVVTRGWVAAHGAEIRPALEELPGEVRELLQRIQGLMEENRSKLPLPLGGGSRTVEKRSDEIHPGIEKILEWADPLKKEKTASVNFRAAYGTSIVRDEKGTVTLKTENGSRHVTITNAEGKELFSGPINTASEREKLSEELRKRLQAAESLTTHFSAEEFAEN